MCKVVPVLRIVGFVFLVLAYVACLIGFLAPFWVRLPVDRAAAAADGDDATIPSVPTPAGQAMPQQNANNRDVVEHHAVATQLPPARDPEQPRTTPAETASPGGSSGGMDGMEESIRALLPNGSYEGLWAKCYHNLNCSCFWSNEFSMEKAFPVWHLAAQGLFGIGLLILLVALVTASFHVCCCHCCQDSFAISTVIGSLTIAGRE
jgi:hypothetical protein